MRISVENEVDEPLVDIPSSARRLIDGSVTLTNSGSIRCAAIFPPVI
jgi:hypothetical protein